MAKANRGRSIARRSFLKTAAAGASALGAGCATLGGTRRRPNVVYVFSDEHRYQSMSFTEQPDVRTPNMKRMADEGVHFTHCISNYPVCSPYRAILMTGRWPYQQGVIDNNIPLSPDQPTLGKAFQQAGYRTGYIGKWHLGGVRAEQFGFDESLIWTNTNTHFDKSKYHPAAGDAVQPEGYNATLMTDQALDFIDDQGEQPFFLMVSLNPPHSNFLDAPDRFKAMYDHEGALKFRENVPVESRANSGDAIWERNSWEHYNGYHAHVSAIDHELGRIIDKVDASGRGEDTIIVYTSDHGSMMGSHGLGSKRQPYEESVRVPLLIRWPGTAPAGDSTDVLIGAIDLMPTLCGMAGVAAPRTCAGRDFSPVVRVPRYKGYESCLAMEPASADEKQRGPRPDSQFIMHISKENASRGNNHPAPIFRGVRTPRYTYATYPDQPWCLFDNRYDPYQLENLIDVAEYADVRDEMHDTLLRWLRKAEDPFQAPSPA